MATVSEIWSSSGFKGQGRNGERMEHWLNKQNTQCSCRYNIYAVLLRTSKAFFFPFPFCFVLYNWAKYQSQEQFSKTVLLLTWLDKKKQREQTTATFLSLAHAKIKGESLVPLISVRVLQLTSMEPNFVWDVFCLCFKPDTWLPPIWLYSSMFIRFSNLHACV